MPWVDDAVFAGPQLQQQGNSISTAEAEAVCAVVAG
jgi:hypothetical protein